MNESSTTSSLTPAPPAQDANRSMSHDRVARFSSPANVLPLFWTIASVISLVGNLLLLLLVFILAKNLFAIKSQFQIQLVDGLYDNFVKMDEAHIRTEIQVSDTIVVQDSIPVVFNLPLKQGTEIILTQDTPIRKATVYLNGQAVPTDIVLRQGTRMNIALDLVVPVNQMVPIELRVPVNLRVPVDIPLAQTELHEPFAGLQDVVAPYKKLLDGLPGSWGELLCAPFEGWCTP